MRPPHSSPGGGGGGSGGGGHGYSPPGHHSGLGQTRTSTRILFSLLGIGFFGLLFYKLGKSTLVSRSSSYLSDATSHTVGSPVSVCVSKTWPYHNPLETYDFYEKLGICTPAEQESAPMTLGQILRGDRLLKSGYEISYGVKQELPKVLCTLEANASLIMKWQDLIDQSYFIEMYVDELPIHQAFGVRIFQKKMNAIPAKPKKYPPSEGEEGVENQNGDKEDTKDNDNKTETKEGYEESEYEFRYYLRTHLHFILGYNEGQVVHATLANEDLNKDFVDITDLPARGKTLPISFTYTVDWKARSDISPQSRVYRQLSSPFAPVSGDLVVSDQPQKGDSTEEGGESGTSEDQQQQQRSRGSRKSLVDVHWLGILNSFVFTLLIVLLLLVLLMKIVKTDLHNMGFRLADEELAAAGLEEETGWKLLHADVFRTPPHRMPLAGMVGCGAHLLMLVLATIIVGCFIPYLERGELLSCSLLAYFLTSYVFIHVWRMCMYGPVCLLSFSCCGVYKFKYI
ncbi:endomembrane protein 70 subfamily protein [Cystoisospora suis]|uniref:Transmembrane 9 superfamily member n=1 Tax=Cystoisospora suis TaxID=483139 RepID=A0A2C6KYZ4_9APIC|nr:endomembrane protein 70 subfamily protein [Cystoisospora suis]